ncbi:hypothetical protein [Chromobacterium sp. ASV23]
MGTVAGVAFLLGMLIGRK